MNTIQALSSTVSLRDAVSLAEAVESEVVGYRLSNRNVVGEYFPRDGLTVEQFEACARVELGIEPAISGLVVETTVPASERTPSIAPLPEIQVPEELHVEAAPSRSIGGEFVSRAAERSAQRRAPASQPLSATATDWRPDSVYHQILNLDGTESLYPYEHLEGVSGAGFMALYHWTAEGDPALTPDFYGLEFEVNLYNDYDDVIPDGLRPFCPHWLFHNLPDPWYHEHFYAQNRNYTWIASDFFSLDWEGGNMEATVAYADTNDWSDPCNRNSIAVGLRYPGELTSLADQAALLLIIIAPNGNQQSSRAGALIQAVDEVACIMYPWVNQTDCMGVTGLAWPDESLPRYRYSLGEDRHWEVPNLCWESHDRGDVDPILVDCPTP